jgi:hypothetical protein
MKRVDTTGYTFSASAKTVTFSQFAAIGLGRIFLINNNTRGVVIYDPSQTTTKGSLAGSVLTLDFDTTGQNDADSLSIFWDDSTYVSAETPMPVVAYGELLEAIEAMRFAINTLTKTIGMALPNAQGFPIMEVRQATASNMNVAVSGTVTSNIGSGSLANQTQIGGFAANDQIPALMHLQADNLRRNISVT